jgi:hypothetical protein
VPGRLRYIVIEPTQRKFSLSTPHSRSGCCSCYTAKKKVRHDIELSSEERSLLIEVLKGQMKRVREDMFYRHDHPDAFYEVYLQRYSHLIQKLDAIFPKAVFIKWPKF